MLSTLFGASQQGCGTYQGLGCPGIFIMRNMKKAEGNALDLCMSTNNEWKDIMGLSANNRYKDSSDTELWHVMVLLLEQDEG
eukprot:5924475-Ditylum_brightwellii.AAC.1